MAENVMRWVRVNGQSKVKYILFCMNAAAKLFVVEKFLVRGRGRAAGMSSCHVRAIITFVLLLTLQCNIVVNFEGYGVYDPGPRPA